MKKAIIFLLAIAVLFGAATVGELMVKDSGYVLIAFDNTTAETTLWAFLVFVAVIFVVLHLLLNLLGKARVPTARLRDWGIRRRHLAAQRKTLKGLLALSEGNWWKAQRFLSQGASDADIPLINYLAAARAAHEQGNDDAADELLNKARLDTPQADVAIGITQAQIQLSRGQLEPCLATLLRLRQQAPKNSFIMRLLKDVYIQLKDWDGMSKLLPEMQRHSALSKEKLEALQRQCYLAIMQNSLSNLGAETEDKERLATLTRNWRNIPDNINRDEELVKCYTGLLMEAGAEGKAETFLKDLIKRQWDERLVNLYGRIAGDSPARQLDTAKGWQKEHSDSASLMLTLGRLSMRNEHWGKAIEFFEQSLQLEPSTEAYSELTRLLQHLGESERSQQVMQQGLALLGQDLPALPMPEQKAAAS